MLRITLRERKIEAIIRRGDKQVCIDREGIVLEIAPDVPVKANVEVIGLSVSGNVIGKELSVQEAYQFEALKMVLRAVADMDTEGFFTAIDVTEPLEIGLKTDSFVTIRLGQTVDIENKLELAGDALRVLYSKGYDHGVLDVSNAVDAVFNESSVNIEDQPTDPEGEDTPKQEE